MSTSPYADFLALLSAAAERGALRRLVLSRPREGDIVKVTGKLCAFRGATVIATEAAKKDGKVLHARLSLPLDEEAFAALAASFSQYNIITAEGDAEYRRSAKGKEALIAPRDLAARLATAERTEEDEALDRKKNHILSGDEPFLRILGVADADGRIHDKKQAKFRQINRFLEHLETVADALPKEGTIRVFDLCCGKSYLSFAVYHYLANVMKRPVDMLCLDLKEDVIEFCADGAARLGFDGMRFLCDDVRNTPKEKPDLVISLHACDIATDLVLEQAIALGAEVVLSTPCCHRTLSRHIACAPLAFVSREPQLCQKLSEALTDGLRALRLSSAGYRVTVSELTDPENTPKNTIIRAVRDRAVGANRRREAAEREYRDALAYLFGDKADAYLNATR